MNSKKIAEAFGGIDDRYLNEALEYKRGSQRGGITMMKKIAAIAACAVFVIGAAALSFKPKADLPAEPTDDPVIAPAPSVTEPAVGDKTDVVEIKRSYNERIANGEDVDVETYIGKEYYAYGYTFVLRNVNISQTLPDGITVEDLRCIVRVGDYGEDGWADGVGYDVSFTDCLDAEGRYSGPTKEGYRWVFVTIDITNNSDEEKTEYSNIDLCGGDHITSVEAYKFESGTDNIIETYTQEVDWYVYNQSACYISEHTDSENYDGQAEVKKFDNVHFEPNETKTLVIGYAISDHFVYDDLYLQLIFLQIPSEDVKQYIPLK